MEEGETLRRTGDLKLIQELNRSIVLDMIRQNGPISRVQIAEKIKLSPTTVTSAVNDLIQDGLVYENGIGESRGGRKPILLSFDPDSQFLIGVSIRSSGIVIAEINLEAVISRKKHYSHNVNADFSEYLIQIIREFLSDTTSLNKCIGISIITQGIVDSLKGIILNNTKLKLKNIPIKVLVEKEFELPVSLDNDTNAYILAEKTFGDFTSFQNMLYIEIGEGVGAGIVVNGAIYRGNGGAGEFGHTSVDKGGVRCDCGNVGCLENYVGWPTIYSRILTSIKKGKHSFMSDFVAGHIADITPEVFVKAIRLGDELALKILDEVVGYLASGIVNLVHLFNPEVILLGGEFVFENPIFISKVKSYVKSHAFEVLSDRLEMEQGSLGKEFEMIGAAAVILHDKFRFSIT